MRIEFKRNKKILIILIIILSLGILCYIVFPQKNEINITNVQPYTEEYNQILQNPKLLEKYKSTHKYLDDLGTYVCYIDGFDYIGYSKVWDTLCIGLQNDETRYYIGLPSEIIEEFNASGFSLTYYKSKIEPYFQFTMPNDPNISLQEEYVIVRN